MDINLISLISRCRESIARLLLFFSIVRENVSGLFSDYVYLCCLIIYVCV